MISNKFSPSSLQLILMLLVFTISGTTLFAQKDADVSAIPILSRGIQRVGNTFESAWLIDNQTTQVPLKRTGEFDILHRFGTIQNGYSDMFGFYAPSNIRIGLSYVPINNLQIGFGFTKERLLWDYFAKYAILREEKQGGNSPVSLTYFVNMGLDTRPKDNFKHVQNRYSFFHQLMVARKLTRDLSLQASVSLSHFNTVPGVLNDKGEVEKEMLHDHIAVGVLGRYKISDAFAFIANFDMPITNHPTNNPLPNLSAGIEIATPLHAFQVFVGNYKWIVPQYNNMFNQNDLKDGAFLIGFNVTRLLDLQEESLLDMMFHRKSKMNLEEGEHH
ncbi:MAG: hypothetical protein IPL49_10745 [Saprospirales bacterium]|nr:hypothetical protein [Saprospirales bacterium]MBK8491341.1 hypothetical protein [Saprospirales bacterium]